MTLHVQSSLPKAGSELMQALLAQHPSVYASSTSPLIDYWFGASGSFQCVEAKSQPKTLRNKSQLGFLFGGALGYYNQITDKEVIVDKSRGWMQYYPTLFELFPKAKMVSVLRKPADILSSLERVYRANPFHPDTNNLPRILEARLAEWTKKDANPFGIAATRLAELLRRGMNPRIMYVSYYTLLEKPQYVMEGVFKHLDLDPIEVDTQHIVKSAQEDDSAFGIFGKHCVHPKLGKVSQNVFPKNIQEGINNQYPWLIQMLEKL